MKISAVKLNELKNQANKNNARNDDGNNNIAGVGNNGNDNGDNMSDFDSFSALYDAVMNEGILQPVDMNENKNNNDNEMKINDNNNMNGVELDGFIIIHQRPRKGCGKLQCNKECFNLSSHFWLYSNTLVQTRAIKMGMFSCHNITTAHCDPNNKNDGHVPPDDQIVHRGIAKDKIEPRMVQIHGQDENEVKMNGGIAANPAFSPNNCQLKVKLDGKGKGKGKGDDDENKEKDKDENDKDDEYCSFFSMLFTNNIDNEENIKEAKLHPANVKEKCAITYHMFALDAAAEEQMRKQLKACKNDIELFKNMLSQNGWHRALRIVNILVSDA